ncbi:MAG: UDP-3-O-[3-hydroxymyristoyl] N-acetylglucosamine deacetylase [Deltaproteobacteria bacterium]|nr:UDP-3-O-[3-hydroxymyristoyl] N-acetylglucosamine deacetylase [Deltaproteobacteria bacterium]
MNVIAKKTQNQYSILIIDDEEAIRKTLTSVFQDEGYLVESASDGEKGLAALSKVKPSLVLLDIWMPGMDGIETLKRIREEFPDLPVIMISGHATIATATEAMKLGAADFIEKPLDLSSTLESARRSLGMLDEAKQESGYRQFAENCVDQSENFKNRKIEALNPIVFADRSLAGRSFPQRTLKSSALLYGQGLHSGKKSGLILEPLPENSGIHFIGVSETTAVPAHVNFVESTGFATTVRLGKTQAGTIEHLMSALHAYGITNLLIKCNGEVPVMDGSAIEFCSLFDDIGVEDQNGEWFEIEIKEKLTVGNDSEFITIEPADSFTIDYTLSYPEPLGHQHMVFTLNDVDSYKQEIAPARTFGFVKDIEWLQSQGLALGGRFDNFVLFGEEGTINCELRFENEPVRHKVLDAIGDLFLLGRRIRGKVTARMSGHSDNIALLSKIRDKLKEAAQN